MAPSPILPELLPERRTLTYAETQGEQPFNWNTFLAAPTHSDEEWEDATNRAGQWVTCACGNTCATLPRRASGAPVDEELWWLGESFACQIMSKQVAEARLTLARIEERSTLLLDTQAQLAGKELRGE